ncbi:hypothetical protein G9U51_06730 [Calidifontibacter sp. DB0510]|uniref:Uncharacterized protein n=1 Tax=Metallococcus carri TaxID=1656884 RepID=A0A967AZD2_9MICO|nr:hypothetical protein [Metallococcus carri]NHN55478.1 hypothetical protein [Metallococcus carri]NOP38338.1 hypothetical protein [Calidifontibacter sp. DB2511S]
MQQDEQVNETNATRYRVRRAPRLGPFLATGAIVGLIVAAIVANLPGEDPMNRNVSTMSAFGYLAVFFVPIGVAVAAVIVILLDRRSH